MATPSTVFLDADSPERQAMLPTYPPSAYAPTMEIFQRVADAFQFSAEKMKKNALFASDRFFCDVYTFEPGQNQTGHRHAGSDKIYYVLGGVGDFRVDAESRRLEAGAVVFCPAGSEHAVANPGPERLALLVFMAPPPK